MEVYIFNDRDRSDPGFSGTMLDWNLWDKGYLPEMLCRCAKVAKKQNKKYFAIQYYGNDCFFFTYIYLDFVCKTILVRVRTIDDTERDYYHHSSSKYLVESIDY